MRPIFGVAAARHSHVDVNCFAAGRRRARDRAAKAVERNNRHADGVIAALRIARRCEHERGGPRAIVVAVATSFVVHERKASGVVEEGRNVGDLDFDGQTAAKHARKVVAASHIRAAQHFGAANSFVDMLHVNTCAQFCFEKKSRSILKFNK